MRLYCMVALHLIGTGSVLVSILVVWLLRDIVGLRLVLHSLTHVDLLLVSTHSMVVVHHAAAHMWVRIGTHKGWRRVRVVSIPTLAARSLKKLLVVVWLLLVSILPLGVRSLLMHLSAWIVLVHVATLLVRWMIGLHLLHSHVLLLLLILSN